MLLKVKVTVLSAMVACTCLLSTTWAKQKTEHGDNGNNIPAQINYQHATYENDRSARSVSNFGRNARNIIRKLLPLKYRLSVFDGAKLVKKQGRTRYWEKLGGKLQFEEDLATMYRRRSANEVDAIESFNGMGGAGMPYSLRIERNNLQGQNSADVITYLRKWGELNDAYVVKIRNAGYH